MTKDATGDLRVQIRVATDEDEAFVTALSGEAFNVFGEYDKFLPRYLPHPDVMTSIATVEDEPVGFTMLALVISETPMPWQALAVARDHDDDDDQSAPPIWVDAELVAIAVSNAWQGKGVGRHLLDAAIQYTEATARARSVRSLQLNVADTNQLALTFFRSRGFVVVDADDGLYPRGQQSFRMARRL